MKTLILLAILLLMAGCAKDNIVIQKEYIKQDITKVSIRNIEELNSITTKVVDNKIVLEQDEYKKIILNFYSINNYILYLKSVISYYESEIDRDLEK